MRWLIIILSFHIFSVQTKLLYLLNGGENFSYLNLSEQTVLAMLFSLSYAIATAIIIYKSTNKRLIILYACLDALGVLLYYFALIPIAVAAFYFAIYTFVLIASTIAFIDTSATTQRKLAEALGIHESKLSRAIKRTKNVSKT